MCVVVSTHKCGLAQAFITKAANFLGAEARKDMPARIHLLPGIGRKLQQGPPELPGELQPAVPEMIEPFAAMAPSAEAPMTAPGECQPAICFNAAAYCAKDALWPISVRFCAPVPICLIRIAVSVNHRIL